MDRRMDRRTVLRAGAGLATGGVLHKGLGHGQAGTDAVAPHYTPPTPRQTFDLNPGWRFHLGDVSGAQATGFDDAGWTGLALPHTWNAKDGEDGGDNYYRGVGWYRRHLTPAVSTAGRQLFLQFDGANTTADVWVNGVHLGQHKGGYARFRFNATAALTPGADNVIAVKVTNAADPDVAPLRADYTFFGGIYRDVSLIAVNPVQFRMLDMGGPGVYLRQRSVSASSATVDVRSTMFNNGDTAHRARLRTVVVGADGVVAADLSGAAFSIAARAQHDNTQSVTLTKPRLWNGTADPFVHQVTVELLDDATGAVLDAVTEPLGLRTYAVDPATGFSLNGKHLSLHGVNRHQDLLDRGWAIGATEHAKDFALMDEMGVNLLRTAHYQQDQRVYTLADQYGFAVHAEVPFVDLVTAGEAFAANVEQQLREMIRQNYNHPSILFWSVGNEQRSDDTLTNTVLARLAAAVRDEDPDRLSTYASSSVSDTAAINAHTDLNGYNRYYGWYYDDIPDFGPWADGLHAKAPTKRLCVTEYGAGGSIHQHAENPTVATRSGAHPEEFQSYYHEQHWKAISARPFLWGSFVWCMFDFASDARNEGDTRGRNDKGLVTYDRATRKDAFYFYKANWNPDPFVHLTSARWTARTVAATSVKVYANTDNVTLTVNGKAVGGAQTSADHIYRWSGITLKKGANTIQVTGAKSGHTYTDSATWTLA